MLQLSVSDFVAHASSLASADELSVYIARHLMRRFAPSLLWITLHDIDVAHAGCYSLYIDGIRRTDRLCAELWKTIQSEPEYAGKTTLFILPDFGRDSDDDAGGNGFQHHRTGDVLSRTTWMIAVGPGIRPTRWWSGPWNRSTWCQRLAPYWGLRRGFRRARRCRRFPSVVRVGSPPSISEAIRPWREGLARITLPYSSRCQ